MTPDETEQEIERDTLIATALTASTPEQCSHAEELITAWMQTHPRDFGVLDAGEMLAMMSDRYDHPAGAVHPAPAS